MNTPSSITKRCTTIELAQLEAKGHSFFSNYYSKLPPLLAAGGSTVTYGNVRSPEAEIVTTVLSDEKSVDLRDAFSSLAAITNNYGHAGKATGGTQLFYIDRVHLLQADALRQSYAQWAANKHTDTSVNGQPVEKTENLLDQVFDWAKGLGYGYVAPSQGDVHERNLLSDGSIIDFEGAGYNLVATDIATFVWHTLFAGNHFGPKYAKWATSEDRALLVAKPPTLIIRHENIQIDIEDNRIDLLDQYLDNYVHQIESPQLTERDILCAIAFRLLTTFDVSQMTAADIHASFALATFFFTSKIPLDEALEIVTRQNLASHKPLAVLT